MFGDNSSGTWSQEFSFTAAPSSGPSVTTRVVVYGGEIVVIYVTVPGRHYWQDALCIYIVV